MPADATTADHWFGNLPRGWDSAPLRFMVRFESGSTPDKSKRSYWDGTIPWVSPKDMKVDAIADSEDHVSELALRDTSLTTVPVGSVLLVVRGMILAHSVPVALTTAPVTINQDMKALRCSERVEPRFLKAVVQGAKGWFLANTGESSHGTKKLETDVIGRFLVPLPPVGHQRAIVDYLDAETARIDALIAAKENLLAILAEKRSAIVTDAVTRGLNPTVETRESGIRWLGKIPAHWHVTRLKLVAQVQTGIALGKKYGSEDLVEYPYLRVANVQDGFLDLSEVKTIEVSRRDAESCRLQRGDVLMNEGGDADKLGRGAIWTGEIDPCLHQNHVFAVRPRGVTAEWLNLWTSSDGAKAFFESRAKQSTNLASISATNLKEIPIPIPPGPEQRAICEHVARELAKMGDFEELAVRTIKLLRERRDAVVAAAVTGQLDVEAA